MTGASAPGSRRRAESRRIDWLLGAQLLAQGTSVVGTAVRLGCSRSAVSRRRKRDAMFREWIEEFRARQPDQVAERIAGLRRTLEDAIETEVKGRNVRVILWLADRLKLVTPPTERTPEQELRHLLGGLSQVELREFETLRDA